MSVQQFTYNEYLTEWCSQNNYIPVYNELPKWNQKLRLRVNNKFLHEINLKCKCEVTILRGKSLFY